MSLLQGTSDETKNQIGFDRAVGILWKKRQIFHRHFTHEWM